MNMIQVDTLLAIKYAEKYERLAQHEKDEAKKWRGESEIFENQSIGAASAYEHVARDMRQLAKDMFIVV